MCALPASPGISSPFSLYIVPSKQSCHDFLELLDIFLTHTHTVHFRSFHQGRPPTHTSRTDISMLLAEAKPKQRAQKVISGNIGFYYNDILIILFVCSFLIHRIPFFASILRIFFFNFNSTMTLVCLWNDCCL